MTTGRSDISGPPTMPRARTILNRLRKICLSFPEAEELEKWGKPHFCVRGRIFAGCGEEGGQPVIGFKLEMQRAEAILQMPGFWKAPYVGHHGWVSMDPSKFTDWETIEEMIGESYRLIAPKRLVQQWDGD